MNSILFKAELIPLIRTLPSNDQGRDYVVGDLHGCRQLLDQLLEFVDFSPENDRLFSVGDLIDRGSDSLGCLALLEKPWFYAVRGNHEEMLLDFAWKYIQNCSSLDRSGGHPLFLNGGTWIDADSNFAEDRPEAPLSALLPKVQQLPMLIVVGEGKQRFHIVHAELYDGGKEDEVLLDRDIDALIQEWHQTNFINTPPKEYPYFTQRWLWGRILMKKVESASKKYPEILLGLSPTFCGHNISHQVRKILSHICIDTGAFMAGGSGRDDLMWGLSLVGIKEQKIYFTNGSSSSPHASSL